MDNRRNPDLAVITGTRVGFMMLTCLFVVGLFGSASAQTAHYYISDVLPPVDPATCTDPEVPCNDFYRLALTDASPRPSFSAVIPTSPTTGIPLFAWGIAYVSCDPAECAAADADARNFRLFRGAEGDQPDIGELLAVLSTVRWGDLTGAQKSAIRNKLTSLGMPVKTYTNSVALRVVLQDVGQYLQPGFNEAVLWVSP